MEPIFKLISERKSELAFTPKPIPSQQIMQLFEAARWAPSSYNEQPWMFYFAGMENPTGFKKMLGLLSTVNQEWAKNASAIIVTTAKKLVTRNGNENIYAMHDTALAEANLVIQAQSMGFATHIMGGFDHEESRSVLNIPEGYFPVAAIAVGYPGEISALSPTLIKRAQNPRIRKAIEEIVIKVK